jgi:hypothetical protein
VSEKTIIKWKSRTIFEDKSARLLSVKYALSELEILIAVELRASAWWVLDEITEIINPEAPEKIRKEIKVKTSYNAVENGVN